jgi:hypothetical protein
MVRRLAVAAFAVISVAILSPVARAQQSDTGQIRIVVTDAQSKAPVGLARVLLTGPVIASELTGTNGEVLFTDVPDGIYRARILKEGYDSITSAQFEVVEGRAVEVSVSLAYTAGLKVIGHVSVRSTATIGNDSLSEDSAQRKLSQDLADALNKLSGVTVSQSSDSSDATTTISLEGHDASQTQLTLDGIPLNAPGTAGNLGMFATDLFSGASVHLGPQLGGLGGGVNFTTLEPTLSWLTYATTAVGSYGKYNYSLAETGSSGKFGIALETTDRVAPSLVYGERYLDASGLDYVHDGTSTVGGDLVKLHYAFSDTQTLIGTFLNSTVDGNLVCLRLDGAIPCGDGPNNGFQSDFNLYSLTDDALLGATTVQASIYGTDAKRVEDELNRYVDDVLEPNGYANASNSFGYSVNATLPSRERHTIAIQAYGTSTSEGFTPLVPQSLPYYTGASQSSYDALQASDTIRSNDELTLNEILGVSHASNAPATILGTAGATWHPNAHDTYSAAYSLGGVAAGGTRQTILTDPASLQFDCYGDVAYGTAPGDQPGASNSTSVRLGYTHTLSGGNVSLSLYRQVESNVVLPADVNGTVLAADGILPPGYAALVQPIWDSPAGCNYPPGTPFTNAQLYFTTPIAGTQRVYQGVEVTSFLTIGPLVVQPFYNLTQATVFSADPRIVNPYSIFIPGKQIPNVPLNRAGLTLDYKSPGSAVEYLMDAQYTGSNNWAHLPAYLEFDGGVSAQLDHGTLTAIASNFTNEYGGTFTSPQWEVPYATLGGTIVRNLARPLQPREYSLTYTVRFGQGAQEIPAQSVPAAPRGENRGFFIAGGPGPGGTRAPGRFRSLFEPLPTSPPAQPFAVKNDPQACPSSDSAYARQLSSVLSAFAARIEAAKTASGYPATMAPPALTDATIAYHGLGATYALTITPKAGMPLRNIVGCLTVHVARPEDVSSRHLYAPQNALFFVPQLQFMPEVGLYFAMRQQQPGQESFRVYVLPSTPPRDPFEIRSGGLCTGDALNTATSLIHELEFHFQRGSPTPSFTITTHAAASGTWYEIAPGDPGTIPMLLACGRVATASEQELNQRGYDGKAIPELNYTPALGIYMVRPEFRNGGVFLRSAQPAPSPTVSPQASPMPSPH